jgi:membrane protein YdbS with pleckstrin-like domain
MAQSPPTGTKAPVAINKYLLPREVQVATVRQHPAVLIPASAVALAGLLIAGLLTGTVVRGLASALIWIAWGFLLLRLVWKICNWAVDYFVVTTERLLLTTGFLTRKVAMMPLGKVQDMSFKRTFPGRLLGYGEFIVESASQDQALRNVEYIPYPEQLYLLVCGMLFPSSADDAEDLVDHEEFPDPRRDRPANRPDRPDDGWDRPDDGWDRPDGGWDRPDGGWDRPDDGWNRPGNRRDFPGSGQDFSGDDP